MTNPETDPLDAPTAALAAAVLEVARHLEAGPLPSPQLFALARSAELLAMSPGLATLLGVGQEEAGAPDELHLTPIALDDGGAEPGSPTDPLAALQEVQWPDQIVGGALACDLAPQAWALREGVDGAALSTAGSLRVIVAALSDGTVWTAVRRRDEEGYVMGEALIPDLTAALRGTLPTAA